MILHRVEAVSVGPFVGPPAIAGPFGAGLNILAAPNETGKTTLLKAAGRALFDRHTCQAAEIKALRPAGTSLGPAIAVEFELAVGRFRIDKTFLQTPRSLFQEWVSDRWRPLAEGDAADDRLQALLQSFKPGRGATEIAHWGMLGYLWMRQGEAADWPEWSKNPIGQTVQSLLAKVELDPFIESVRMRLWSVYLESYTPTGQLKTGGKLRVAEDELAEVDQALAEIDESRRQFAADEETYARLVGDVHRLEEEHLGCRRDADTLLESARSAEILLAEQGTRQHAFDVAQMALKVVEEDAATLARHERASGDLGGQLVVSERDAACRREEVISAQEALLRIERSQEENATLLHGLQSAVERARLLVRYRQGLAEVERISRTLDRCTAAQQKLDALVQARAGVPVIPAPRLRRLETLSDAVRAKRVQLEVLGLTVELTPDAAAQGVLSRADEAAPETLPAIAPGEIRRVHAGQALTLSLPGWGTVRMLSGAAEIRALGEALLREETEFRGELASLGARGLEEARAFADRGRELDEQLKTARQELAAFLDRDETPATLAAKHVADRRRFQALADDLHPTAAETGGTLTELEAAEQRIAVQHQERQNEHQALARRLKEAREGLTAATDRRERAAQVILGLRYGGDNLRSQATAIQGRYPAGIDAAKDAAENAYLDARITLKDVQRKMPPDAGSLVERSRRAAAAADQVRGELARLREAQAALCGRLEWLGTQALYTRGTTLLARREILAAEAGRARTQGRAARLAHDLIERRKQAATRSVLAPLQDRLGARFGEVSGERERRIFLNESLEVLGLGRKADELVRFEDLSQGAREQLLLCLRLAVAEELAAGGGGPQSLILDDVLVNTDATRQRRVLDLLAGAAANGLQVVVCTCHPERYRGVGEIVELRRPTA